MTTSSPSRDRNGSRARRGSWMTSRPRCAAITPARGLEIPIGSNGIGRRSERARPTGPASFGVVPTLALSSVQLARSLDPGPSGTPLRKRDVVFRDSGYDDVEERIELGELEQAPHVVVEAHQAHRALARVHELRH